MQWNLRTLIVNYAKEAEKLFRMLWRNPARALCFLPSPDGNRLLPEGAPIEGLCEIVLPIYEENEPLAVLEAVAKEGCSLGEKEFILLNDLAELVTNVLKKRSTAYENIAGKTHS